MLPAIFACGPLQFLVSHKQCSKVGHTQCPVKPKFYLLGKQRLGIPDQMQSVPMKLKSMQNLKIDSKKYLHVRLFTDADEIVEVAKGHTTIKVLLTQSQSTHSMKTDNLQI